MHHVISVLSLGSAVPTDFSVLMVAFVLSSMSYIIFLDRSYSSCVLSDNLHPSNWWWKQSEFRGAKPNVSGLVGRHHRNMGRVNIRGVFIVSVDI